MKSYKILLAVAVMMFFAVPALAVPNAVNVTGDLTKGSTLTINITWNVDTAKFQGIKREEVRKKVKAEIWDALLPKLVAATKGVSTSMAESNFTIVKEYHDLIQQRPNGTKQYVLKMEVLFTNVPESASAAAAAAAATAAAQPPAAAPVKAKPPITFEQHWNDEV